MAATNSVYKDSTIPVKVSLLGSSDEFNLADETTVFTAEFYIQKKREQGSIVIAKDKMRFDPEDPDAFTALLPTEGLGTGTIACTISGEYVDEEHSDDEHTIMLPFVYSVTTNISITPKYL